MKKVVVFNLIFLLAALMTAVSVAEDSDYIIHEYTPTCTERGYTLFEDMKTDTISVLNEVPALGHQFMETTDEENRIIRICSVCGFKEDWKSFDYNLPSIYFEGDMDGISKYQRVNLQISYDIGTQSFHGWTIVSLQGHSTLEFEKHNYTIRLYKDEDFFHKFKTSFGDWHQEHKYILKANYSDPYMYHNLVCAQIWKEMTFSRNAFPQRLKDTMNRGVVEGFPVAVYHNNEFIGLYTLNLHKDNDLYEMKEGCQEAIVIANSCTTDEALFRSETTFSDNSDWEIEYCGTPDQTWVKERFNALVRFIENSSDEEFRANLNEFLDVNGAIDYLIFMYAMGLTNSYAKDLVLLNYDGIWIPTVYDMEDSFGLSRAERDPATFLPVKTENGWVSGTNSLLWDRLMNVFESEIRVRWNTLRMQELSPKHIVDRIYSFVETIPEECVRDDLALYPNRGMSYLDEIEQSKTYIYQHSELINNIWGR